MRRIDVSTLAPRTVEQLRGDDRYDSRPAGFMGIDRAGQIYRNGASDNGAPFRSFRGAYDSY